LSAVFLLYFEVPKSDNFILFVFIVPYPLIYSIIVFIKILLG
jgi:hypothetical protein